MSLLLLALVMLVIIDHFLKYRPQELIYYKNAHLFSMIIVVLEYQPEIDDLIKASQKSRHEYIFVSVNYALDPSDYEGVKIIEIQEEFSADDYFQIVPILSKGYQKGYQEATQNFLCFMNGSLILKDLKTIDHMANNLVEHQLYTIKESLPYRDHKEGYKLFIDYFRDMNITPEDINMNFFAIKRPTYDLVGISEHIFENANALAALLEKRNVSVIHISHSDAIGKKERKSDFKSYVSYWLDLFAQRPVLEGMKRMFLFLFAFHLFYFFLIFNPRWYNPILFIVVQLTLFGVMRQYIRHHFLQYILTPFYMLFFDGLLIVGWFKRLKLRFASNKEMPELPIDTEGEDATTEETAPQNEEELPKEDDTKQEAKPLKNDEIKEDVPPKKAEVKKDEPPKEDKPLKEDENKIEDKPTKKETIASEKKASSKAKPKPKPIESKGKAANDKKPQTSKETSKPKAKQTDTDIKEDKGTS